MWWPDRTKAVRAGVLACTLLLAGCGFSPLYSAGETQDAGVARRLAAVDVGIINDRSGQILRNALERKLERAGGSVRKRYKLDVTVTESRADQAFQKGGFGTRASLRTVAKAVLVEIPGVGQDQAAPEDRTGKSKVLWRGHSQALVAWNLLPENYAAVVSERDARTRAMEQLADDIARSLAVYFSSGVSGERDQMP